MRCDAKVIVESLNTAVLVMDEEFRIFFTNQSAEQLFGKSQSHLTTLKLTDIIDPMQTSVLEALKEAVKPNFQGFIATEVIFNTGPSISVKGDLYISSYAGKTRGVLAEIRSVIHQQKVIDDIYRRDQHNAAQDLVRSLAHEIKNPLGGIRGAAQLLEISYGTTPGHKDYTSVIIEQTDRLKNLVDRLLGPQRPNPLTSANIHYVLEKVLSLIGMQIQGQIKIEKDYDPSLPEIPLDIDGMEQVFLNIILNATQALDEAHTKNPVIKITTRATFSMAINDIKYSTCMAVSISNNGPQIPQSLLSTIFYPMVTTKNSGSGLGLSLAQSIVQRHQGLIDCQSNPEKTIFRVLLPLNKHRTSSEEK